MKSVLSVVIKMKLIIKRILQVIAAVAAVTLVAFLILIMVLTVTEYKPDEIEKLSVNGTGEQALQAGDSLAVLTWNIGYGALGDNADFFMDGGSMVNTADEDRVQENMTAVNEEIADLNPDVVFLQEVDRDSKRSHHINEQNLIREAQSGYCDTFANNFKVCYVPYPLPMIGKVDSGILTLSKYDVTDTRRFALPCPFSYPVRTANLKRCLMIDRIPIEGSEFVLDVDTVVMAIGTSPNPLIKNTTKGLEVNAHGGIIVNEDGLTSREAVYAGGDAVTGAATVISAMGAGKVAAKAIDEFLSKKN